MLEAKLWVITRFWEELWKEKSKKFGGSFGGRWRVGRNAFYTRILIKEQNERVTVFIEFWDVLEGGIIRKCTVFHWKTMFFEFKVGYEINGFL